MDDEVLQFEDDKLFVYTPVPPYDGVCKVQLVMTKEIFQECYKRWIEPQLKRCTDCNHYGKLSLDCGKCDDNCNMFEPQEEQKER